MAVVELFTHPDCSLCRPVDFVIRRVREDFRFEYRKVNIRAPENSAWLAEYEYDIPVVHLNGVELARHRLQEAVLREALAKVITTDPSSSSSAVEGSAAVEKGSEAAEHPS